MKKEEANDEKIVIRIRSIKVNKKKSRMKNEDAKEVKETKSTDGKEKEKEANVLIYKRNTENI